MWCSRDYAVVVAAAHIVSLYGKFLWSLFVRLCLLLCGSDALCVRLYVVADAPSVGKSLHVYTW